MRVSGTGASRVKVIGLTSEYHVCNPLVWYLSALAAVYLSCLYLFSRDDKLPGFHWLNATQFLLWHEPGLASEIKRMTMRDMSFVPEWLHFHLLPFSAGKPRFYWSFAWPKGTSGQCFSRQRRKGLIVKEKRGNVQFPVSNGK